MGLELVTIEEHTQNQTKWATFQGYQWLITHKTLKF